MAQEKKHKHHHADMLSVGDARDKILDVFNPLDMKEIPVIESLNLTLAEDIHSTINIPPFNNSAMDGYALKASNIKKATYESPVYLKVIGTISAGELPTFSIDDGYSARIMTGAPMPKGADTVVPFEETTEMDITNQENQITEIGIKISANQGDDVRKSGKDVSEGDLILKKGTIMITNILS